MKIGFYPGSFDPFTNGHLHVVKEAAILFDKVVIGIGVHPNKKRRYDKNKMKKAVEKVLVRENLTNVSVITYDNWTADAAAKYHAISLVRGIRNGMDYQYEENIAAAIEEVSGIGTIYIRAGRLGNISSSMVMELLRNGKNVSTYVPKEILEVMK